MVSPTLGQIELPEVAQMIKDYITEEPDREYAIYVGSDSQNSYYTKMVTVVAVHRRGRGGKYFYEISKYNKIKDIRQKLFTETQLSLNMTERLFDEFHKINFDYTKSNISFTIHVDCGVNGPSGAVIPEIIGYIHAMGYACEIKPDSVVASCIADKISK